MSEKNIVEGPPLERLLDSNLGEITLTLLSTHGDVVVQVSNIIIFYFTQSD